MTDGSGTIQARYDYDPYGRTTLVSGTNLSDFQYAGYYTHQPSGLNLTVFRAYDPNTAKWLSRDPMGEGSDSTLYSYVSNSPLNLVDPLGLWQTNVSGYLPGFGFNLTFGFNSGQWNAGYLAGPGIGLGFGGNTNWRDTGCQQKGLHLDLGAKIGAGLVDNLTGSGMFSFGQGAQTMTANMSGTASTPIPGTGVTANYGNSGLTTSPTTGLRLGVGGFLGGGGHFTW